MPYTVEFSNHVKYGLAKKLLDLDADSIKVILMRDGFVFNKDNHATKTNLKAASGAITCAVDDAAGTFTRSAGSFVTDGFVAGNEITCANFTNAGNNSTFVIDTVSALVITVVDKTGMVTEAGTGDETITADDELATGNGYTQDTKTQAFTLTEDDTDDRAEVAADATITWTAAGGDIGPTPGAILYDDTSADDTIICYINFGGNHTAADGSPFNIANLVLYLS